MSDMPTALQVATVKDLSKGMQSTVPPTSVPVGGFVEIKNMYPSVQGLQRRDAWRLFFQSKPAFAKIPIATGETVSDVEGFFDKDNNLQLLAFTSKRMYVNKIGDGFVPVPFGQVSYGVTGVAANSVTCAGAGFVVDWIRPGDIARFTLTGGSVVETPVSSVLSPTQLALVTPAGVGVGDTLEIIREFTLTEGFTVDYTFIPKGLVLVDGSERGIWRYDGEKLVDMNVHGGVNDTTDPLYLKGAKSVLFFNGYLFLGNTIESYTDITANNRLDQKRTVRWSSVTDISEFSIIDYVIFTKEMSEVIKITSSEECPVVFLANGIYYGTPSPLDGLPYQFARTESGAISAVGQKAMCSVPGGMVFIGQKNIYFFELGSQGTRVPRITPIGDPIYNRSCYENNGPQYSRALFSPQQNMLICSFPKRKNRLGNLFYFSFETKSWSMVDDPSSRFTTANVFPYYVLVRWQDGDSASWADYDPFSWFSLKLEDYTQRVFTVDTNGYVYVGDDAYDWDEVPNGSATTVVPYTCVIETGDLDFGSPGYYKTVNEITLTVSDVATRERTADLHCSVEVSTDRGRTWKPKTDIVIESGTFIEDAAFRTASEVMRFRLTFAASSPLFVLSEYELRYRVMGAFSQRGA